MPLVRDDMQLLQMAVLLLQLLILRTSFALFPAQYYFFLTRY